MMSTDQVINLRSEGFGLKYKTRIMVGTIMCLSPPGIYDAYYLR